MAEAEVRFTSMTMMTSVEAHVSADVSGAPPIRHHSGKALVPVLVTMQWCWTDVSDQKGWSILDATVTGYHGDTPVELRFDGTRDDDISAPADFRVPDWLRAFLEHTRTHLAQLEVTEAGGRTTAAVTVPTPDPAALSYGDLPDWTTSTEVEDPIPARLSPEAQAVLPEIAAWLRRRSANLPLLMERDGVGMASAILEKEIRG
ncbi:hypothetical protein GCM10023192_54400 [Amycolatopsis samaneae]